MVKKVTDLATLTTADATDVLLGVDVSGNVSKQIPVSGIGPGLSSKTVALASVNGGSTAGVLTTDASGNVTAQGAWATWTPTLTGWSANPADGIYRYTRLGNTVTLHIRHPSNGTSNATTMTITAPVAAAATANDIWYGIGTGTSGASTVVCTAVISAGSNVMSLFTTGDATGAWSNTGNKRVNTLTLTYEAA